jgi:hypothetical protein
MKINYTKDFTKHCPSKEEAIRIARKVAKLDGDKLDHWTVVRSGRYIKRAEGKLKNFRWSYSGLYKEISVCFTDGRPDKVVEPKETYYIVWIEGFNYKTGDKIKHFDKDGRIVYTHKMQEAMRVKKEDIETMKVKLRRLQIADWAIDSPNTFVETHYAPKGTLFSFA